MWQKLKKIDIKHKSLNINTTKDILNNKFYACGNFSPLTFILLSRYKQMIQEENS